MPNVPSPILDRLPRREFLLTTGLAGAGWLWLPRALAAAQVPLPGNNPVAHLKLAWTDQIAWTRVVDITRAPGHDPSEQLAHAQAAVAAMGGGVVYFPPGVYRFRDSIHLLDGVVLRGADPAPGTRALDDHYAPPSRIEFPKYEFSDQGEGTPLSSAFKGIYLKDPATAANCGVINLAIQRGHIHFREGDGHRCGRNRLVFGCVLRNAARPHPEVPDLTLGQAAWQRYTATYHHAALDVKANPTGLVANNRLPRSGEDNFTMNGYRMLDRARQPVAVDGVVFDYDNRAGIYLNHYAIGGQGGQGPDGTPESHPHGFRTGLVIRDNFVFNTGRCAIGFCGDGVECRGNVIRFARDIWRPTVTGQHLSHGASTNDNRAVEMRGWRWIVDGNDYEVHRNVCFDRRYPINDGEGLMHEDHVNSTVRDSVLTNNRGNAYLSIYQTAGIDGLLVEGNELRIDRGASGEPAIHVTANRTHEPFPCRNVRIVNNTVFSRGILLSGSPGEHNLIQGNRARGETPQRIRNQANAVVEDNAGFEVDNTPWQPRPRR